MTDSDQQSKNTKPIAIIDDDLSYSRATERLLKVFGYNVVCFPSAVDFLAHQDHPEYQCLLTDMHMPQMTGYDFLQKIRADGNKTPFIFITAHKMSESQLTLAQGFIPKPYEAEKLIKAIETICQ
ncbi:response regulator [Pelagicoccus mobilis]|uniref:Response regulator n=1 Tax=Pelagicoccus mobilis TaxID=415221 RepID=A0A934S409_9BACT|nr:response regulator [Pelagicoccus mobilis]MBK1880679.1 response regulator [Pelagicoccus mobilis]